MDVVLLKGTVSVSSGWPVVQTSHPIFLSNHGSWAEPWHEIHPLFYPNRGQESSPLVAPTRVIHFRHPRPRRRVG
jgi:hypothetical protein